MIRAEQIPKHNVEWIPPQLIDSLRSSAERIGLALEPQPRGAAPAGIVALYEQCITALTRYVCLRDGRQPVTSADFDLLCYCVINSENLAEVLQRILTFSQTLGTRGGSFTLLEREKHAIFFMDTKRSCSDPAGLVCDTFGLSFFQRLFSWLIGAPLEGLAVTLAHQRWLDEAPLRQMFNCPVYFSRTKNALRFDSSMLQRPIVRSYRELVAQLRIAPLELTPPPRALSLAQRLTQMLRKRLLEQAELPSAEEAARLFGQTHSTLRRNLAREGISFQDAVKHCRMQRATELLRESTFDIDFIACDLGFSTPGGFTRAFKDWSGCAPSVYRKRLND